MVLERLFWVGVENNSVFHARPTELSRAFLIIRVRNRLGEFASKARLGEQPYQPRLNFKSWKKRIFGLA